MQSTIVNEGELKYFVVIHGAARVVIEEIVVSRRWGAVHFVSYVDNSGYEVQLIWAAGFLMLDHL